MEEVDITLVNKLQQQDIEINTLWDQLFKVFDVNDVLIDFIQRNGLINQLKHEMLTKILDALDNEDKESYSSYTRVYEKIKKIN